MLERQCNIGYRDAIRTSMEKLAENSKTVFIGYNLLHGSRGYKTLNNISPDKIIETPLAENLMIDLGIGMAIENYLPIVVYERHDFMLNSLDGIINHLDKLYTLSEKDFNPKVIIRAIVGRKTPINPGPQHCQDFSKFFKEILKFPVFDPQDGKEVLEVYEKIEKLESPALIIERSELYER